MDANLASSGWISSIQALHPSACQSEIGRPLTLLNPGMDLGHGRLTCPFCWAQALQDIDVLGIVSTALDRLKAGDSLGTSVDLSLQHPMIIF